MSPASEATTTTIQISTRNRDTLTTIGQRMRDAQPEIWNRPPSFDQIIGWMLGQYIYVPEPIAAEGDRRS